MHDPQFWQQQVDGLWVPHVAPVNALVDEPFIGPPEVRAARMAALREALARTARILQEPG
jgi:hypothetical protein